MEPTRLLRAFAWARLALAGLLLLAVPYAASEFIPGANAPILGLALLAGAGSSAGILLRRSLPRPQRMAGLLCILDVALVTAVVAATGGPRSIFAFLYVLSVVAACLLVPRAGALAVAGAASLLYTGLVFGRTIFPIAYFFEAPHETSALEIVTIFLNAATFLVVAIVAGGLAERYRQTHRELETRRRDLRDLETFRDLVFECVGTGVIVLDRGHRITAFNRAAADITGRPTRTALGATWAEVTGDAVPLSDAAAALEESADRLVRRDATLHRPDGSAVHVLLTFSTLRSSEGEPLGVVVGCEDVSMLRRMEATMRQADRLASLGRLSANIAHEIRNPLASLTGAIEALAGPPDLGGAERQNLTEIVLRESARLNHIITEFLAYARPTPLARARTDVAALLEDVLVLLDHRPLPAHVKVVRAFGGELWAHVDAAALRQAVWNLCLNAAQAMTESGGELTVAASTAGGTLQLHVSDTGHGIAAEDLGHVFEPFFSTKAEGSGLGLALVDRVVRDHGGAIDVQSTPGIGTTFSLTLPGAAHD